MEQKTPARGLSFGMPKLGSGPFPGSRNQTSNAEFVKVARELAEAMVAIIPDGFDRVLPRGYSISGNALLMARFEISDMRGQALYARHTAWGEKESRVFLRDLKDGWLDEVSSFMRWQLQGQSHG